MHFEVVKATILAVASEPLPSFYRSVWQLDCLPLGRQLYRRLHVALFVFV